MSKWTKRHFHSLPLPSLIDQSIFKTSLPPWRARSSRFKESSRLFGLVYGGDGDHIYRRHTGPRLNLQPGFEDDRRDDKDSRLHHQLPLILRLLASF